MKVCLDLLPIPRHFGGAGRYGINLVNALLKSNNPKPQFQIYLQDFIKSYFTVDNNVFIFNYRTFKTRPGRVKWEQNELAKVVNNGIFDVFHAISNIIPLKIKPGSAKIIVTLHDLLFLNDPARYPFLKLKYYNKYIPETIKKADRIIVDSDYTMSDLENYFPGHAEKATIIPLAPDPVFTPVGEKIDDNFLFTVSTLEPGKGFLKLLKEFKNIENREIKLFIAGPEGWKNKDIKQMLSQSDPSRIKVLGYISDFELAKYMRSARAFIYPSVEEGFGLPVIEAMASGTPVIVPQTPHYRKTTGNLGYFFDPVIDGSMKESINEVTASNFNPEAMLDFISQYTWENVAQRTLEVYRS